MDLNLVRADLAHLDALLAFAIDSFTDTYGSMNTPENMANYIEQSFNAEILAAEVQHPLCQYWLAMADGQLVGYIKLNFAGAQTDLNDPASLEVERIYVHPAQKRKGIGEAMLFHAAEVAKAHQLDFLWLGVWEKNEAAISFYHKLGFQTAGTHTFLLGDDPQVDFVLRKALG